MRVTILEAHPLGPSKTDVRFGSPFGEAVVRWASGTPVVHGTYDVEFNVSDRVEWDRTGVVVDERAPSIEMAQGGVQLCGTLDNVQADGVIGLRLGTSLILLESVGEPPAVGSTICVTVKHVELYAHNN